MKKTFEFFLVLIIFYGVYSVFDRAAPVVFDEPKTFWVVIVSLVIAVLLLMLYGQIIASSAKKNLKEKVVELEGNLQNKDKELQDAFKLKKAVEAEAQKIIEKEEINN